MSALLCAPATGTTPAGTTLVASAAITYQDPRGTTYDLVSNALSTVVAAVGALVMAPKEPAADPATEGFATGTNVVRTFTLQNASNVPDAYAVTAVELNAGTLASLAFVANGVETPVSIGSGVSPKIAPGETIALRATVQTNGVAVGTVLSLLVRVRTVTAGTANGLQSEWGRSYGVASSGPKLTGIAGPSAPIDKTVDGARTSQRPAGATVHYAIAFANTGGAAAANVVVDDALPPGVHADPASLTVNGSTGTRPVIAGGHLVVTLPSLAVGARAVVAGPHRAHARVAHASPRHVAARVAARIHRSKSAPHAKTVAYTATVVAAPIVLVPVRPVEHPRAETPSRGAPGRHPGAIRPELGPTETLAFVAPHRKCRTCFGPLRLPDDVPQQTFVAAKAVATTTAAGAVTIAADDPTSGPVDLGSGLIWYRLPARVQGP